MESIVHDTFSRLAEPSFALFQKRIVSDTNYPILGIRMPALRRLASRLAKENWRGSLEAIPLNSFEGVLLAGLTIAYADCPLHGRLLAMQNVLPKFDSWAMTDSVVPTLKPKENEFSQLWDFAHECIASEEEYTVRFGIVILLDWFLSEPYIPQVAKTLCQICDERYYIAMAQSWCLAEMAVVDYPRVEDILRSECLSRFVHNKTIQKIRESYRIQQEQKAAAALLRRK